MIIGRDISQSIFFKSVLLAFLTASLVAMLTFRYNSHARFQIAFLDGSFYFLWGILYHVHRRNLTRKILGEYLGIALMIIVIGFALTGGGR